MFEIFKKLNILFLWLQLFNFASILLYNFYSLLELFPQMVVCTQPGGPSALRILHTFIYPYLFTNSNLLCLKSKTLPIAIPHSPCSVMPVERGKPYRQTTWDKSLLGNAALLNFGDRPRGRLLHLPTTPQTVGH